MKLVIKWEDIIHTTEQVIVEKWNNSEVGPGSGSSIMDMPDLLQIKMYKIIRMITLIVNIRGKSNIQGGISSTCFDEILFQFSTNANEQIIAFL
jgi:hypothetical protein